MTPLITKSESKISAWYRATTLTERLATRTPDSGSYDAALAAKRLQRWREQASFDNDQIFQQRLDLDKLSEAQFLQLLGEDVATLQTRFSATPEWINELEEALTRAFSVEETRLPLSSATAQRLAGFLEPIRPLIGQARLRLRRGLDQIFSTFAYLPFDPAQIEEILLTGLAEQLFARLSPTLVMELQIARLRGLLSGETPEARFDSFVALLKQPDFTLALLQEYAVLTRRVLTVLDNRVSFMLDFARQLCADWPELVALFSPENDPGKLLKISGDAGDGHRGGRSVIMVEFSSGLKLVYKPRSLAVDQHFQELLDWLNRHGAQPEFRTLKVLDREDHGWVEFVETFGCNTPDELERFYRRQGAYLALLYTLGARDLHQGNILAAGEHPVLIDLEALLHPDLSAADPSQAEDLAGQVMSYSVLQIGLLPQRIWTNKDSAGVELSGLGGEDGQLSPQPLPVWEEIGTDRMRLVRKRIPLKGNQHRPTLNGQKVNPLDYVEALTSGFSQLYNLIVAQRAELLGEDGPVIPFKDDVVRVVLRSTRTYEILLENSLQPDRLRDALEADRIFDKLWLELKRRPSIPKVIAAERYDLHRGDFPIFTTRPGSTTLWTSTDAAISNFLREPSLEMVQRRLQNLDEADLKRQLWFIQASMSILASDNEASQPAPYSDLAKTETGSASLEQLLEAARAIGNRLEELALRSDKDVTWIGLSLERLDSWNLTPLNMTLYDGLAGVALFLAYLGACTGEERYTELAKATLPNLRRQIALNKSSFNLLGGLEGWGGMIYALTQLGALWNDPALLDEAQNLVELVPALLAEDKYLDFLAGSSGCIGALLALYCYRPNPRTLEVAILCGEHLVKQAIPQKHGVAWQTHMPASQPATGVGRGSTGIGWALLQLGALTGDERFKATGLASLAYERSVFSPEKNNWPDFRVVNKDPLPEGEFRYMAAWCHGAPGIGLTRLSLLPHYPDPVIRDEVQAAVKTTLKSFGHNHCLCHGDLGNMDLLVEASQKLNDPALAQEVSRLGAFLLKSFEQRGWVCSNPLHVETPGLMAGLAGIGYGLLRMAKPERVPSVLILEPPR